MLRTTRPVCGYIGAHTHENCISTTSAINRYTTLPQLASLPSDVRQLAASFRIELAKVLEQNLIGIYLFGSIAFPGFEPRSGDIDFYVLLRRPLTQIQREDLDTMHRILGRSFRFGKALDGFYITLSKASKRSIPTRLIFAADGRLHKNGRDDAWALHRQHLRQGACIILYGPKPKTIVPPPSWDEIDRALNTEISFAKKVIDKYPYWTVLSLCRLIYSFENRRVVASKIQAAKWALRKLPNHWRALIQSALRVYLKRQKHANRKILKKNSDAFFKFASDRIAATKLS
jgi:hypothetical protein